MVPFLGHPVDIGRNTRCRLCSA